MTKKNIKNIQTATTQNSKMFFLFLFFRQRKKDMAVRKDISTMAFRKE